MNKAYQEKIYAGTLGKIIGVYMGRPVEGWTYGRIAETFGEVSYYPHRECGVPLVVADDDISGTFGFFRALEDNGFRRDLSSRDIGNAWLNYIVEDKTILWWGGLGRSTEHTAYLNLKSGIRAPQSGSIAQNGRTLAEQIGAQIFIDAFAMACPGDPGLAVDLVKKAASVSHDGLAVEAAGYLAAMEAMAFDQRDLNRLLDDGLRYVREPRLLSLIEDVRDLCAKESSWRRVRERLDRLHGYHRYPGCCPMQPNHAMVLAALILGKDDFQSSLRIAVSAGWDTDCNAGNVGCLNGIRLGLAGIDAGADLRTPVADRLLVVTSDGGSSVSDAVRESRRIIHAAAVLRGERPPEQRPRFDFEFPGALQGWEPCPNNTPSCPGSVHLENHALPDGARALAVCCRGVGPGRAASVSTPTFIGLGEAEGVYSSVASPTLYETQAVKISLSFDGDEAAGVSAAPYILHYDKENRPCRLGGASFALKRGENALVFEVPPTGGMPIFRFGLEIRSERRFDGRVLVRSVDWQGAPRRFLLGGMLMTAGLGSMPAWLSQWASSAKHFQGDFFQTLCVSHPGDNGVATLGDSSWRDCSVESKLSFSLHRAGGLVLRSRGHRRYYAALFKGYDRVEIIRRRDDEVKVLCEIPFSYVENRPYAVRFCAKGQALSLFVDGEQLLFAEDDSYACGGAGYIAEGGSMSAGEFLVQNDAE
ncbi:MAG: ADP-ribosylglycohydrolase family protein [Bacillota bacterium]